MEMNYEKQGLEPPLSIDCVLLKIADSIADSENMLNCILSAEYQKLKKVIYSCSKTSDLIAVNDSVSGMVKQVAQYECVLKEKLATILPCLCDREQSGCNCCMYPEG